MPLAYRELLKEIGAGSPALIFAIPIALLTYIAWPRTRYFGNTAPLLVAVVCAKAGTATTVSSKTSTAGEKRRMTNLAGYLLRG